MNVRFSLFSRTAAVAAGLLALTFAVPLQAQESVGQVLRRPNKKVYNFTVAEGTPDTVLQLKKFFYVDGISQEIVRFDTILGEFYLQLAPGNAPKNVANFLSYVDSGAYNDSIFHRLEKNFVLQGGGYKVGPEGSAPVAIGEGAKVANEYNILNTRGTIAAAKPTNSPDGATSQWFINLVDNSTTLGTTNNGGFTAFGQVIADGMIVVDQLANLPVPDISSASPFDKLPLFNYIPGFPVRNNELVTVYSVAVASLYDTASSPGMIRLSATSNKPDLVTATTTGSRVRLIYVPGQTGTAKITVTAKGPRGRVRVKFRVTVAEPELPATATATAQ